MKLKNTLLLFFLFAFASLQAQLSGIYTIGGSSSNYATFSAAISALHSQGINNNVVFNVSAGTYTEQLTINSFTGNSSYTVTFQSANADSSSVILSHPSSTSGTNNFLIKFNQAKNIIFKGMTFKRSGTNSYSRVIIFANSSSHIQFTNSIIENNSTSSADDLGALVMGQNLSSSSLSDFDFNYNHFKNGSYAIYIQGVSSGTLALNLNITHNIFDGQYRTGVYAAYQKSPHVNDNIFTSTSTYYNYRAVDFLYCNEGPQINRNIMTLNKGNGIYLLNSIGCCSYVGEIFNNMISLSGSGATGISMNNSGTYHLYFNSINLIASGGKGYYVSGSVSNHNYFGNNIISCPGGSKAISIASNTNFPFDYLNYNDYYSTSSIGDWRNVTNISTIAAWKTASMLDNSSLSVNPNFVSNTNLHLQNSPVQRMGSSALTTPATNTDIDGKTRHFLKPDMGAHERSFDDLSIQAIEVNHNMCVGTNNSVKVWIKNKSNHAITLTNQPIKYQFANNTASETFSLNNLSPQDSVIYVFSQKINHGTAGSYTVKAWLNINQDINLNNDTLSESVQIDNFPVINLPQDTTICHDKSVVLNPGNGFDSYLWSTGATSNTISLDTSYFGIGGQFVWVEVSYGSCKSKDSTLVIFTHCAGIQNIDMQDEISVYPNPTSGTFYLKTSKIIEAIEIRDLNGRLLKHKDGNIRKLDMSELPKGLYIISIRTSKQIIRTQLMKL